MSPAGPVDHSEKTATYVTPPERFIIPSSNLFFIIHAYLSKKTLNYRNYINLKSYPSCHQSSTKTTLSSPNKNRLPVTMAPPLLCSVKINDLTV